LVSAGFSLAEVSEMTLDQINAYSKSIAKKEAQERVNTISSVRIGHHADDKQYKKLMRDYEREMNK